MAMAAAVSARPHSSLQLSTWAHSRSNSSQMFLRCSCFGSPRLQQRAGCALWNVQISRAGLKNPSALQSHYDERGASSHIDESDENPAYSYWNSTTEKFAGSATFAFLLLQLPQTILNAQNLMSGNTAALFAVSWMSLLTCLMGNLSLLSYFAMKKENGAMIVQAVGVFSTYVVLAQLALAGAMPSLVFIATTIAVGVGYVVNYLNYRNALSSKLWRLWQDIISIGGVSVLAQVMWSTFEPFLPSSLLPGIFASIGGLTLIIKERQGKLTPFWHKVANGLAAWSATLLFMWSPIAQMWMNISNPANLEGLSVFTVLLAMVGNGLLLPRALFTRDLMWFTGSAWGAFLQGWGLLLTMFVYECLSGPVFGTISLGLAWWIVYILKMDSKANGLDSTFSPLGQLLRRS